MAGTYMRAMDWRFQDSTTVIPTVPEIARIVDNGLIAKILDNGEIWKVFHYWNVIETEGCICFRRADATNYKIIP